jgi:hypothetical protein
MPPDSGPLRRERSVGALGEPAHRLTGGQDGHVGDGGQELARPGRDHRVRVRAVGDRADVAAVQVHLTDAELGVVLVPLAVVDHEHERLLGHVLVIHRGDQVADVGALGVDPGAGPQTERVGLQLEATVGRGRHRRTAVVEPEHHHRRRSQRLVERVAGHDLVVRAEHVPHLVPLLGGRGVALDEVELLAVPLHELGAELGVELDVLALGLATGQGGTLSTRGAGACLGGLRAEYGHVGHGVAPIGFVAPAGCGAFEPEQIRSNSASLCLGERRPVLEFARLGVRQRPVERSGSRWSLPGSPGPSAAARRCSASRTADAASGSSARPRGGSAPAGGA